MITPKENYLIAARGGKPIWVPDIWEDVVMFSCNKYTRTTDDDGIEWDPFGVSYKDGFPTAHKFWDDVTEWRNNTLPNLDDIDWDEEAKFFQEKVKADKAVSMHVGDGGNMLILANAMGFTDALVALLEEEEELQEFFAVLTEFTKKCIYYSAKVLKADVISYPDDSSNGRGPFMSRETYRKLFTPYVKECCDYAHAYGMVFNIHNCGDPQFILDEYLDMGVDVVNANIDSAHLREFRAQHGGRLCLEGGWKNTGDYASNEATEEAVKRAVDEYYAKFADDGGFISHINMIVRMGDQEAMKRKVLWGQEQSNKIRFEWYNPKSEEEMEYLSQFTHGMDEMLEFML